MRSIWRIISFTKRFWKLYLLMGLFVVMVSLLSLAGPLLSKQVVDLVVAKFNGQGGDFSKFYLLLGMIIAADGSISLLTASGQWVGDVLALRLQTFLSQTFYQHVLDLHVGYFDNEVTGRIVNRMYRGISSISDFIQDALNNFLPFFLTAAVTILLLAHYSLWISLLLLVLFPAYILISHQSSITWERFEGQKNRINDQSQGRVSESLAGVRVVKSFAAELWEHGVFVRNRRKVESLGITQSKGWHIYDFLRRAMLNVILFAIYVYVIYWTFNGRFTIGEMTLLVQLVNQARFPLFAMSFILGQIQQASAGSLDFFKVLETKPEVVDKPRATRLQLPQKIDRDQVVIKFERVSFGYDLGKTVLRDINFSINAGQKLALVAESGAGKSTLVNLLLRFYEVQKGKIYVGGQDIAQVSQDSLRQQIAVVFQESLLFSGTIYENIKYGRPKATRAEVIKAAMAANAHKFIEKLPEGYGSLVGERGVRLSGGQKQRVAIARAMLKNAPIVILDEATSSLDSKAELLVQQGLETLMKNKTSIIIAHRLSTIAGADYILAIAGGRIVQYGQPGDLLKNKQGLYAQLVRLQQQLLRAPSEKTQSELRQFDLVG